MASAAVVPAGFTSAVLGCGLVVVSDLATRSFTRLYDYLLGNPGPGPRLSPQPAPLIPRLDYRAERNAMGDPEG